MGKLCALNSKLYGWTWWIQMLEIVQEVAKDKVVVQDATDDELVYFLEVMLNGDVCKEVYSRELPINIVS